MTGEGWNMDFVTQEVAGTLSPFVCREEPFQRTFPPSKARGSRLGPAGGRGAGGDKLGSVFSHGDSLILGRGRKDGGRAKNWGEIKRNVQGWGLDEEATG